MTDGEIRGVVRAAHEHDKYVVAHSGDRRPSGRRWPRGCAPSNTPTGWTTRPPRCWPGRDIFLTPTLCVTRRESWMRANGFEEHIHREGGAAADEHLVSIQRAIRAGVNLVNGTDYPPGDLVDGAPAAVHELLLMAEAGLTRCRRSRRVSVQRRAAARHRRATSARSGPATSAISIAVDADPLDDLAAMRNISLVVQGGRVVRDGCRR